MKTTFHLLRVSHWVKNLFIFLPLFFSGEFLSDTSKILNACVAFFAFSFAASSIYILNDIRDVEDDRLHPKKKNRPFAANKVKISTGIGIAVLLILLATTIGFFVNTKFLIVLGIYFVMNVFYSLGLKNVSVLDIVIIATGFLLRIIAGGLAVEVFISQWILIMTFLLALFLALAKRRDDLLIYLKSGKKMRASLGGYNLDFVNVLLSILAGVIFIAYLMYTLSEEVVHRLEAPYLYATSLFILLGIIRYLQLTFVYQKSGNPTEIFLKDRAIQAIVACWILAFYFILYLDVKFEI